MLGSPQDFDCPHCGYLFEIVTVKLSFFSKPTMLLVCVRCGLAQVDGQDEHATRLQDWIAALDWKPAFARSRDDGPIPSRPAQSRIVRGISGTSPIKG
jgi:hypothetical protein